MKDFSKALFIQLRRIGDVLMCTPSIRAFKKAFPNCRLDFMTEIPDVLKGNPHLNKVIPVDIDRKYDPIYQHALIRSIRHNEYDLVVDFFANPRSAYYAFLTAAEIRLSYGFGHRRWAYNLVPPRSESPAYSANDKLALLSEIGISSDGPRLEFYPTDIEREEAGRLIREVDGRPLVTISPVSRRQYRRWPLGNFARLADIVKERYDAGIVVLAGPGEEKFANEVISKMKHPAIAPRLRSLGVLGAIFDHAALHIGNDNGPKHIAVASGAPTVTIYGPHNYIDWTYPDFSRHQWLCPRDICLDCLRKKRRCQGDCIESITVEEALKKVVALAESLPAFQSLARK